MSLAPPRIFGLLCLGETGCRKQSWLALRPSLFGVAAVGRQLVLCQVWLWGSQREQVRKEIQA